MNSTYGIQVNHEERMLFIREDNLGLTADVMQAKTFYHQETVVHWVEYLQTLPKLAGAKIKVIEYHQTEDEDIIRVTNVEHEGPIMRVLNRINRKCEEFLEFLGLY